MRRIGRWRRERTAAPESAAPAAGEDPPPAGRLARAWRHGRHIGRVALGISDYRSARRDRALVLVRRHAALSVVGGAIPVPFADIAAVTAIQLRMLARIAGVYQVPFSTDAGRLAASSVLLAVPQGLSQSFTAAFITAGPMAKIIPGIGTVTGGVAMAAFGATVTYALGVVFIDHFESGGTLLDLDPEAGSASFRAELAREWARLAGRAAAARHWLGRLDPRRLRRR